MKPEKKMFLTFWYFLLYLSMLSVRGYAKKNVQKLSISSESH